MRLAILKAGPLVSVQDGGRPGMMRFGVPASGPMDRMSFRIANAAVGNPDTAPAIEISLGGLTLECTEGCVTFALAGGGFRLGLGADRLGSWSVATLHAGTRLSVAPGPWGSWTYLALAGTLRAGAWLGSAATHALSGLGGGLLRAGGTVEIDGAERREARCGPIPCPVWARPRHSVGVVPGPQDRFFPAGVMETFLSSRFTLTDASDRMGVRLSGPKLHPGAALDMPSEAILRGSVQVAGDGVATVLLADHQTTGGYPRIATLVSGDIDGFAQLRSRDAVRFCQTDPQAAIAALRARQPAQERYLAALRHPGRTRP
ncbi:biotin-dependent carboxyltransferase family protein [Paracoccaceae bacterium Fryx2]|nr:biotin-dependent carboxyltransferase family protein [Paracoccaceae bacterium Fryx2]